MYFLFIVSVLCSVQNFFNINKLNKSKTLLNRDNSRKFVEYEVYECLNINLSTNFGTVLELLDINELDEILKPLLYKDDSIKSVDDKLYKLYTNGNLTISFKNRS